MCIAWPALTPDEPLDVIGNGTFGLIRKVRRKADGALFARKELNFERMNERDRKQIVAEVCVDRRARVRRSFARAVQEYPQGA